MEITKEILREKYIEAVDSLIEYYDDDYCNTVFAIKSISDYKRSLEKILDKTDDKDIIYSGDFDIKNINDMTWIPADTQPPESGDYIVQINGARSATMLYYGAKSEKWIDDELNEYEVDKWMPLPEV